MPGGEVLGASFQIDITNLKAGLNQANRLIKESNSEFKAAAAGMGDWTKSQDGLTKKIKNLNDVASVQQKKVNALQTEYDNLIADGLDPTSSAAVKLRTQINNEKAALANTEAEIKKYNSALDDMQSETTEVVSASQKLKNEISSQQDKLDDLKSKYSDVVLEQGKNSKAAKDLADEINALNSDLNKNKQKLNESEIALDDTAEAAKDSGDGFTVAKGAIATFIGNGLNKLVDAAKNAVSTLVGLAGETREFRQDLNTLTTAYDEAGFSTEQATDTWKELYSIFGEDDRAVEAANNISRMSKNQKDLNMWTKITTGIWGTYQDALPVESLAESAGETAKVGKVTGTLADALNWSSEAASMFAKYMGKDVTNAEDAFNVALSECTTEQERQALITDTLTALYGDAADTYKDTAGSIIEANKATADLTLKQATFGEKIEPITTSVKNGFNKILDKILELAGDTSLDGLADKIDGAFSDFIDNILPKIADGLQWIIDNKDGLIAGITGIGTAFIAFKVVSIIQSVTSALKGMSIAQAALNFVMSMNPIGLVVAAIAGLIAAFVVLWKKCDWFREFWINLWDNIKSVASSVWEAITGFFTNAWETIKGVWSTVSEFFSGIWESIKNVFAPVVNFYKSVFGLAWDTIKTIFQVAAAFFGYVWDSIKEKFAPVVEFFKSVFSSAWNKIKEAFSAVASFFASVWAKVKKPFEAVASWFKGIFQKAWEAIKGVFSKVGDFFGGIWDTIKSKFTSIGTKVGDAIGGAFKTAINAVIGTVEKGLNFIPNNVNKMVDKINELPGVDISPIQTISLPRLAKGGVVKSATNAIIGEDGAEAIIPLERNKQWIKQVAKEMMSQQKQGVVINQTNNYSQAHSRYEIWKSEKATVNAVKLALKGV
jgi:phage-related protein